MNALFITLIPKVKIPQHLHQFQPISLVGCIYKIIYKILSRRLKRVLHKVIDHKQYVFNEGRRLLDIVLVENETLEDIKRKKEINIFLKVDYEIFLRFIQMGFHLLYVREIRVL